MAAVTPAAAEKSLAEGRKSIQATLRALDVLTSKKTDLIEIPAPIPGLADIALALLAGIRKEVTTLSLAFKPPATLAAIPLQVDKITDQMGRLVSSVLALAGNGGEASSSLVDEWRDGATFVGNEVERLMSVLHEGVRNSSAASSSSNESPYLAHTGMVWEAVDRLTGSFPRTEAEAVAKRWEGQKATVRDAWSEFKEFLEDQEDEDEDSEDDGGFDDFEDDEWGALEKAMGGKLSAAEKTRAEAAKPLLGLHQILHATLPRYMPLLAFDPEQTYAPLLGSGGEVVAAFDTAVSAMYPKQDVAEIFGAMDALNEQGRELAAAFKTRLAASPADAAAKDTARTFADRWEQRLDLEVKAWAEKRLSLAALSDALDA